MIRVCSNCSNVDIEILTDKVGDSQVEVGCLGECGQHSDSVFGYVDDEFVIEASEEAFIKKATELKG